MRKALTLAILGTALAAPFGARAETTPAFIGATACEAAAPLRTDAMAMHRAVSARGTETVAGRRAGARGTGSARPTHREAARTAQRPASRPAQDQAVAEADGSGAADEVPALRRAVHFCVGTPGARRTWFT